MKLSPPAMIVDLWIKESRLRRGRDHFGAPCACQPDIGLGGKGRPIPAYGVAVPSTMPASRACSLVRRRISRVNSWRSARISACISVYTRSIRSSGRWVVIRIARRMATPTATIAIVSCLIIGSCASGALTLDAQARSAWQAPGLCPRRGPAPVARRPDGPHPGGVRAPRRRVGADCEREGRRSNQHPAVRCDHIQPGRPVAVTARAGRPVTE